MKNLNLSNKFKILQELIPRRYWYYTTLPVQVKKSVSYCSKSNCKKIEPNIKYCTV